MASQQFSRPQSDAVPSALETEGIYPMRHHADGSISVHMRPGETFFELYTRTYGRARQRVLGGETLLAAYILHLLRQNLPTTDDAILLPSHPRLLRLCMGLSHTLHRSAQTLCQQGWKCLGHPAHLGT